MAYPNCKKKVLKAHYACAVIYKYRNLACSIVPNRACRPPRARICTRNVASAPYLNPHGQQAASHSSEKRASKSSLSPQGSDNAISVLLRHGNRYYFFFTRILESCSRGDGVFTGYLSLSMLYTRNTADCIRALRGYCFCSFFPSSGIKVNSQSTAYAYSSAGPSYLSRSTPSQTTHGHVSVVL